MLISLFVGDVPLAFVFNGFEVGALVLAVLIAQHVTHEGESAEFEGLQPLAVYAVLGLTFYFD
jgi:Ca2+:H+ antiporter